MQVLYCQAFSDKDLMTSVAAVESVRTVEDLKDSAAKLRETITAAQAAVRAVESAADSLVKAATAEGKKSLKANDEGTLSTRLYLAQARQEAVNQMRQATQALQHIEPLFEENSFTMRLLRAYNRHQDLVDATLTPALEHWALRRLIAEDRSVLRLGITELLYFEDVPPAVVIDEYVELAKAYGDEESPKLVNGVLDRVRKDHPRPQKEPEG